MKELDSCEYCGKAMPTKDRKKWNTMFFHAQCKLWAKERAKVK